MNKTRRSVFARLAAFVAAPFALKASASISKEPSNRIVAPPTFWYENKAGDRWIPGPDHFIDGRNVPEGFEYQWSAAPCTLRESCCTTKGPVMSGNSGWSEDLVLAMTGRGYRLRDAIMIAANSCERCMNALASEFGLKWGYSRDSHEYLTNGTSCNMCVPRYANVDGNGVMRRLECDDLD